jgi:hypothetical protein
MSHNRTVTFNSDSTYLEKKATSALFYLDIAGERILADNEYPASNEFICSLNEAKQLLYAMIILFTATPTEALPADADVDLDVFTHIHDGYPAPPPQP